MMLVFTVVFTIMMPNTIKTFHLRTVRPAWNFFSSGIMSGTNSVMRTAAGQECISAGAGDCQYLHNLINFLLALVVLFAAIAV